MSFVYFEDTDGEYTIANSNKIIFVDFKDDGTIFIQMDNDCNAYVQGEMFAADDFEVAYNELKALKEEKLLQSI